MDTHTAACPPTIKALGSEVALIIVTHDRADFLNQLLLSIGQLTISPGYLVIIDNSSVDNTRAVVEGRIASLSRSIDVIYLRQDINLGGAGGFNVGMAAALARGANWFWLMDDDVEIVPGGLSSLLDWSDRFKCFHGQRYGSDGTPFFSSQRISRRLAVQVPILPDPLKTKRYLLTNWACFEGLFIHRSIVLQIGLPDPRFFIVWDDAMYGFRASQITEVAFVDSFVMRRARTQPQINLGVRHLSAASNLTRYYMMRNRALIEMYYKHYGNYHPLWFRIGTLLVLVKELVRLFAVERQVRGLGALYSGMKAAAKLRHEKNMTLMPSLDHRFPIERVEE